MPVTCNTSSPNLAKFNKHNNIFLRSHKHYAVIVFLEKLQKYKKWISNYKHFSGKDEVYNDFLNKLMKVVHEIAPSKEIRIKNNRQEWFDREIAELIHALEKFKNLKNQGFTLLKKITKKLSVKFKILLGKRKEKSMKLILDKK